MLVSIVPILFLATGMAVQSLKLPASFPQCKRSDPDFSACIGLAIEKSISEIKSGNAALQMLPLDPLEITEIDFNRGSGPVSFNLKLIDIKTTGLGNIKIMNATVDRLNGKFLFISTGLIPRVHMEADYVMDGKFLILPLKGEGKANFTINNIQANMELMGIELKKGGKIYLDFTDLKMVFSKIDSMTVNFENLFNGDATLGESTNALINENWPEFWTELKEPFEEAFAQVFEVYSRKVFDHIPYNEVVLD